MHRTAVWICLVASCCAACGQVSSADELLDASAGAADTPPVSIDGAQGGDIGAGLSCGDNWVQGYCIRFTFHGEKFNDRSFTLQRDLTGTSSTVVFGNTHMQPPAVSLAVHDFWQLGPFRDPLDFNLVLGNLVAAPGFPAFVPQTGDYAFGCAPPYLDFTYNNIRYRSTCPGLAGGFHISSWSATPGGVVTGSFSGQLQQYLPGPGGSDDCVATSAAQTCKSALNTVDVAGSFGLTLPAINGDVAP